MGMVADHRLGAVGSVVGGMISSFVFGTDPQELAYKRRGLIMSTVGAVHRVDVVLGICRRNTSTTIKGNL